MEVAGGDQASQVAQAGQIVSHETQANVTNGRLEFGELILVAALIALILISVIGNCLVCVAIFTDRRLRKLGNAFIVSLAIADLFVSCLVMTFALCNDLMNYWIFGDRFCDIWISFDIMCCTASILNLCAISLDRFIHIKDCLLYNQLMTKRVALSAVVIIWFISALVSFLPINLGWHKPDYFVIIPTTTTQQTNNQFIINTNNDINLHSILTMNKSNSIFNLEPRDMLDTFNGSLKHQQLSLTLDNNNNNIIQLLSKKVQDKRNSNKVNEFRQSRSSRPNFLEPALKPALQPTPIEKQSSFWSKAGGDIANLSGSSGPIEEPSKAASRFQKHQLQLNNAIPIEAPVQMGASLATLLDLAPTSSSSSFNAKLKLGDQSSSANPSQMPQCMLTLTPTYAIISSTISFYIPCIIMLGLYSKLFACARRHVKNIQAISKPLGQQPGDLALGKQALPAIAASTQNGSDNESSIKAPRSWLRFQRRWLSGARPKRPVKECPSSGALLDKATVVVMATSANSSTLTEYCNSPLLNQNQDQNQNQNQNENQSQSRTQSEANHHNHSFTSSQQKAASSSGQQLATHKAAVTLGIIMGTFLFCWVPFFCLNIIKAFCVDCIPSSLFRAFTWLGYANSALNPIIYGIHNSEFRNAFNRIFFKHLNIKNSRHYLNRRFSYDLRQSNFAQAHQERQKRLKMTLASSNSEALGAANVNPSGGRSQSPQSRAQSQCKRQSQSQLQPLYHRTDTFT